MSQIYLIKNKVSGGTYIGQTRYSLSKRFSAHITESKNPKVKLHKAISSYGKEHFSIEILEECDSSQLDEREKYWISLLNPNYNMTLGGDGGILGYKHTEDSKNKISKALKGKNLGSKNGFYGKTHSEEQKKAWSESRKGNKSPCGFQNHIHNNEVKERISKTLKNNPNIKRVGVIQYDKNNTILFEYSSISEAAKAVHTSPSNIKYVCEGRLKTCKGYYWTFQ